jgi:hypothetical protein
MVLTTVALSPLSLSGRKLAAVEILPILVVQLQGVRLKRQVALAVHLDLLVDKLVLVWV